MPVYVYRCEDCGVEFEKRQSFSDAPLTECESCHGPVRKLLQPSAVIFKGSGWYCTDHKSPSGQNGINGSGEKTGESNSSTEATSSESKDPGKAAATDSSKATATAEKK